MKLAKLLVYCTFVLIQSIPIAAEDNRNSMLEAIASEIIKHDLLFKNVEAKFVLESRIHAKPPAALRKLLEQAEEAPVEIHIVRQGKWKYIKVTYFHTDAPSTTVIAAYDGNRHSELRENTHLVISDRWQSPLLYAVPPHLFVWSAWGFRYKDVKDLFVPLKNDSPKASRPNFTIQRTRLNDVECFLVEKQIKKNSQGPVFVDRFFFVPKYNYLATRAECFSTKKDKIIRIAESYANDWREVAPGIWLPFQAVYRTYCAPEIYGHNGLHGEMVFRVLSVNLNPNYPKSFFSNVPMPTDGVIETYRGGRLVSRQVVGNPQDEDAGKQGLPPWAWLAGNLLLFALLLAVYLRYRGFASSPVEEQDDSSPGANE